MNFIKRSEKLCSSCITWITSCRLILRVVQAVTAVAVAKRTLAIAASDSSPTKSPAERSANSGFLPGRRNNRDFGTPF